MLNKYRLIKFFSLLALSLILMSWGYNGHNKINGNASLSFTLEMDQFMAWSDSLAQHASDADDRKDIDPNEGPRHYLDIDNYPGFITNGRIPQTYDSVVALYGESFVIDQGVLPWATKISYDSLVNCFIRFDWAKAVLFASDMGHYIADAHNPLHITRNYNGQYSGNYGIHSRYESGMINKYKDEIIYSGDDISFITDVNGYIFNYIYSSYVFVDSILIADNYAQGVAGNDYSDAYKAAMWEKTRSFTIPLFKSASHALAELIYSAWVEAGKPDMNSGPGIFEHKGRQNILQLHISPNPFRDYAMVNFSLPENSQVRLTIVNVYGITVETLVDSCLSGGIHEFSYNLESLPPGIYFMSINTGKTFEVRKMLKIGQP
jgi:hypothetical protein